MRLVINGFDVSSTTLDSSKNGKKKLPSTRSTCKVADNFNITFIVYESWFLKLTSENSEKVYKTVDAVKGHLESPLQRPLFENAFEPSEFGATLSSCGGSITDKSDTGTSTDGHLSHHWIFTLDFK